MKFLLCDACIIIKAHELKLWQTLIEYFKLSVASTVINEAKYYIAPLNQMKKDIDLKTSIVTKKITLVSMRIDEISNVLKIAEENKLEIHRGEAESIAALSHPQYKEFFFCTSDKQPVLIAYVCGILDRIVSFESCFIRTGTRKKILSKLPTHYLEKVMKNWKTEAIQRF